MTNCSKCGGTGLLPFIGKDGKVRNDVHLHCDCHPTYGIDARETYRPSSPDEIDFPVSHSFYRSLCWQHGWPVPVSDRPEEVESKTEEVVRRVVYEHSDMSDKNQRRIGQLEYELTSLKSLLRSRRTATSKPVASNEGNDADRVDVTERFTKR